MTTLSIQAEDQLITQLSTVAQKRKIAIEDLAKAVLTAYVQEELPTASAYSFVGIGHSGTSNLSQRVNQVLADGADRREGWNLPK